MNRREPKPHLRPVDANLPVHVGVPERISDILAEPLPEWQVRGLIPRRASVVLFGDSQSGKTFLALELAACVSTGTPFNGWKVKQGSVLYVSAEGRGGIGKRLRALLTRFPDLPAAPFRMLRQAFDFRQFASEVLTRTRDVQEDSGEMGLIVVDTLSQTIFGDENGEEMTEYIGQANWLAEETGAPVLIVHHQGKDASRGARGNSSLRGNSDVMIRLSADNSGTRTAANDPVAGGKIRDGEPTSFAFQLRQVIVGMHAGQQETSCVVEWLAQSPTQARPRPQGARQRILYAAAEAAVLASRRNDDAGHPVAGLEDVVRRAIAAAPEQRQFDLRRALNAMVQRGVLSHQADLVWFP